jgi:hypothetical protein
VGPLREDGYVDYVAALNEHCSKRVTPENNGAVLFWQAMGPAAVAREFKRQENREQFFERLGMSSPPGDGDYFVRLRDYADVLPGNPPRAEATELPADWRSALGDEYDRATKRPWSKEEFPKLAAWLEGNERPLRLIVQATQRPRSYVPLIARGQFPAMIAILGPGVEQYRDAAGALKTRAMLRLHEGKVDEAWRDLLACHRLARHVGRQGPTVVDVLVASQIEESACSGDAVVAELGRLTAQQAHEFRNDLGDLSRLTDLAEKFHLAERYTFLDSVTTLAREGTDAVAKLGGSGAGDRSYLELLFRCATLCDWDEVLRRGNADYDRLVEAARVPGPSERRKALFEFVEGTKRLRDAQKDVESLKSMIGSPPTESQRATVTRQVGNFFLYVLMPSVLPAAIAEQRAAVRLQLTEVAFALAAYRSDHGNYPEQLAQLVPNYVEEVPSDPFAEGDVRYNRRGGEYLLYSLGMNGEDDGGRGWNSEPRGDDIVIRTSSQKR